jgi:hypothetical protein
MKFQIGVRICNTESDSRTIFAWQRGVQRGQNYAKPTTLATQASGFANTAMLRML